MQDLTICPKCKNWKEYLRVAPCCSFKYCDDCIFRNVGCIRCNTRLDFQLLPLYKPLDVLMRECLSSCKYCGELHSTILLKSHERNCTKVPLSGLVKDIATELPPNIPSDKLTEQDMRDFFIKKNLLASYHKMLPVPPNVDDGSGFINHVVSDTDTLSGIAIRYSVTVEELRRANHLMGNIDRAIHQREVLKIPVAQTPQIREIDEASVNLLKRRLVARFARKTGCKSLDEAQYYLDVSAFNFDEAVEAYIQDSKVPLPTPPKTISTIIPSRSDDDITNIKPNRSCCFSIA